MDNTPFLRKNRKKYINTFEYAVSPEFCVDGVPVLWRFRKTDSKMEREIISLSSVPQNTQLFGTGQYVLDKQLYHRNKMVKCCLYPDLKDKNLQKDYGANDEFELFDKLVSDPDDYANLLKEYNRQFSIRRESGIEQK